MLCFLSQSISSLSPFVSNEVLTERRYSLAKVAYVTFSLCSPWSLSARYKDLIKPSFSVSLEVFLNYYSNEFDKIKEKLIAKINPKVTVHFRWSNNKVESCKPYTRHTHTIPEVTQDAVMRLFSVRTFRLNTDSSFLQLVWFAWLRPLTILSSRPMWYKI